MFPLALLVSGLGLIVASVAAGEAELSLLVVFPVVSGSGTLFLLGAVLIIASFFVWFLSLTTTGQTHTTLSEGATGQGERASGGTRYGGVVLIGPVPIAFGSTPRLALAMLAIGVCVAVVLLCLLLLFD